MKYVQLGNSDLTVSRICLGCMGFGAPMAGGHTWTLSEEESREIIRYALDQGINFFDTAMAYAGGTSEAYVGRALRDFAPRDQYVIATKYTPVSPAQIAEGITGAEHIRNCLDASLKRLDTDHIDLYIMHMWDYLTPVYETMRTLNDAVKAGKIRAIGVSNCYAWQIAKANALAEKEGFAKIVSIQGHYNLIHREEERDMRPFCLEDNIAMTPYSALAAGRLSRLPGAETTKRLEQDAYARFKYDATAEQDNIIIGRVAELAEKRGVTMTEISLAWLLTKVTSPVCGATKVRHIDGPVHAVDLELTAEEIAWLEEPYVPHALAGVMAQRPWQKQAE
ncbi:MAG: aldo/keto reductase [Clostridiales bacterium]|nr:aldo/keto reductase [Clostridiales bacterium]